mmetsp:Transcript_14392/g.21864  ORF Transcript_14392/g.21864 Transcript_14392/m.21864 type:complete len:548 (+) Transcript_14392:165-1808(+)
MSSAPGADHKVPVSSSPQYGSFGQDVKGHSLEHSGLQRTNSFTIGMRLNPPINRYGVISRRKVEKFLPPQSPFTVTSSLSKLGTPLSAGVTQPVDGPSHLSLTKSSSFHESLARMSFHSVYPHPEGCTFAQTVFNMANCLVGSGILGLPFAFAVGGWMGLVVMFFTTIATSYTGKVIGKCIRHLQRKFPGSGRDKLDDMAELCTESKAFGKIFKFIMNLSVVLELWGGACSRIILQGSNLNKIFPSIPEHIFMIACTILVLPTVFIGMEALSYLSMLGLLSSFLLLVGIIAMGSVRGIADDTEIVRWHGLPITFGVILFSYSGHAVFPQIYREMKDKNEYNKAVDTAFYVSFVFYGLMASGGYLFYGALVHDQVTLDLPEGIVADTIILLVVVNTMLSYPLIMSGPIEAFESFLGLYEIRPKVYVPNKKEDFEREDSDAAESNERPCLYLFGAIMVRTTLVLGTLIVALTFHNFALVATFIGAVFTISVSLIFPCVIQLKMLHYVYPAGVRGKKGLGTTEVLLNYLLILVGIYGMISGVWEGIKQLS